MFESGVDEVGGGALDRLGAGVEELAEGRGVPHISHSRIEGWLMNVHAGHDFDFVAGAGLASAGTGVVVRGEESTDLGTPHSAQRRDFVPGGLRLSQT